jgi:hypothetical protein
MQNHRRDRQTMLDGKPSEEPVLMVEEQPIEYEA